MKRVYEIRKINGDSWRPGMPKEGYCVYFDMRSFGWAGMRTFATVAEAKAFTETL